jgi:hypothetical protein
MMQVRDELSAKQSNQTELDVFSRVWAVVLVHSTNITFVAVS